MNTPAEEATIHADVVVIIKIGDHEVVVTNININQKVKTMMKCNISQSKLTRLSSRNLINQVSPSMMWMSHRPRTSCLRHNIMIKVRAKTILTTNNKATISTSSRMSTILYKIISQDSKKVEATTSTNSIRSQDTITSFRAKMKDIRSKKCPIINTQHIKQKRAQTGLKLEIANSVITARSCTAMLRSR